MEMLLMGVFVSMFGLAVACLAFGAATRNAEGTAPAPAEENEVVKLAAASANFFVDVPAAAVAARTQVPIEALLLQIENHVRLEHAAAECFLEAPDPSLLHSRTMSAFVN
jgi:hypothetical protein